MGLNAHASAFAPPTASDGLTPVIGPTREALKAALKERGVAGFRADQIWKWVYQRGVTDFAEMSNLAKDLRAQMAADERRNQSRRYRLRDQKEDDDESSLESEEDEENVASANLVDGNERTLCGVWTKPSRKRSQVLVYAGQTSWALGGHFHELNLRVDIVERKAKNLLMNAITGNERILTSALFPLGMFAGTSCRSIFKIREYHCDHSCLFNTQELVIGATVIELTRTRTQVRATNVEDGFE